MSSTKTLKTFLEQNPNFYDNVDGYTWEEGAGWVNTGITEYEKDIIFDNYQDRYIVNDNKFARLFRERLNSTALRFAQMNRIEQSAFDPLVSNYSERQLTEEGNRNIVNNNNKEVNGTLGITKESSHNTNGTVNRTLTPDITETESGTKALNGSNNRSLTDRDEIDKSDVTDRDVTTNNTENNTHELTAHDKSVAMDKVAPQSIAYEGASAPAAGSLPALDWKYATSQKQTETDHSENSKDQNTSNGTENEDTTLTQHSEGNKTQTEESTKNDSETNNNERKKTGSETSVDNTESTSSETGKTDTVNNQIEKSDGTISESTGGEHREIITGRSNITPQEAFGSAISYLKRLSTHDWLVDQLATLFMPVSYDPDEDDCYFF